MGRNIARERVMGIVKIQEVGGTTYTVAIPKNVREIVELKKGEMMCVKLDEKGRIIYEPVNLL
jgi:bifunctional DNA-binding transcriptional regulator/antitoxin component of YhaV-PrlF toxin-antitoxin module